MKFSLILSTVGRNSDLDRFLAALWLQTYRDFEVIVVGPPEDAHVRQYLKQFDGYPIIYAGGAKGHSRALNLGLQFATGGIVAFPDDDCWYPPRLLEKVHDLLLMNPFYCGVSGRCLTEDGKPSSGRWDKIAGPIRQSNVWQRSCSVTIFVRRQDAQTFQFDESLGVGAGTRWGGGEDPDFVLRLTEAGRFLYYDPAIIVHHPEWSTGTITRAICEKASAYGRGLGRVLRKHKFPLGLVVPHMIRPLGGAILSMLTFRASKASYHWAILNGRMNGWLSSTRVESSTAPILTLNEPTGPPRDL